MACCSSARAARALVAAAFSALLVGALALILWLVFGGGEESAREELARIGESGERGSWLAAPAQGSNAEPDASRASASSVARREEEAARAIPAGALLLRVVDAAGEPAAGIPVGLIDLRAVPLPFFDLARLWNPSLQGGDDPEPPSHASKHYWSFERGVVRRGSYDEAESITESIEVAVEQGEEGDAAESASDMGAVEEHGDGTHTTFTVSVENQDTTLEQSLEALLREHAEWSPHDARPTLWFADAFHWRGTTDERGEVIARWDRTSAPEVEVAFAFPCRTRSPKLLRAAEPPPNTAIELELPPIVRTEVLGVHDLDVRRDARWKARLAARAEFKDGSLAWIAWDDYASLGANDVEPQALIWERGLPVRLDAYLDAPFAPLLAVALADAGAARHVLRSTEHYAGLRLQLQRGDGGELAAAGIELQLTTAPANESMRRERWSTRLDAAGRIALVFAARPQNYRTRELRARLVAMTEPLSSPEVSGVIQRDPRQDRYETHFELDECDLAGQVRELPARRFGEGPVLLAGRVQWSDGAPVAKARVFLPRGLAADLDDGDREALACDESGAFARLGIPRTPSFDIEVLTGSFGPRPRFTVQAGQRELLLQVPRRGGLAGRVVFERPQDLVVTALGSDGHASIARPNVQGEFAVQGVAVGSVKLSFRAGEIELASLSDLVLSSAQLERPSALHEVDLRARAHVTTLVLRDERGGLLPRATIAVVDASTGYRLAGTTSRTGELRLVIPPSVASLVVAVPGYRDQTITPLPGRVEVGLVEIR
jgi:hypothetical protein